MPPCGGWPRLTAESLRAVSEPLRWRLAFGRRRPAEIVAASLRAAARGPYADEWEAPPWLLPHQIDAAYRVAGSLELFGTALLADAVGLGKTYVALAVAERYRTVTAVVPATLLSQWRRATSACARTVALQTHEAFSNRCRLQPARLVIVDEAHRFRNPATRRYDRLARGLGDADLLLVTATPVVNRAADLGHLLLLGLTDHALRVAGLDSLRTALEDRTYRSVTRAAQPVTVARSHREALADPTRLPRPRDGPLVAAAPLPRQQLRRILALIDALQFPGLANRHAAALMRLHLCHRLASSAAACRESVLHHLSYLDRAVRAAGRGERLTRASARVLFAEVDDWQLEFATLATGAPAGPVDVEPIGAERTRVEALLRALPRDVLHNPKAARLEQILCQRRSSKTIVFTSAVRTALDLAHRLRWQRVGVVGAGRAWIASGAVTPDAVLARFAPRARRVHPPRESERIEVLIATDLVSEGLDLQDAQAIVHYDLPWSPLRLAQRVGRIARLGSQHAAVDVWWFAPATDLERRLRLLPRLAFKTRLQRALGVAHTSAVGAARVTNQVLRGRERFATGGRDSAACGVAVVLASARGVVRVDWHLERGRVAELFVWNGGRLEPACDYGAVAALVRDLVRRPVTDAAIPGALVQALCALVRERLSLADRPPADPGARRLARTIVQLGQAAGRRRDRGLLRELDAALDTVFQGLRVGGTRELTELLARRPHAPPLEAWRGRWARGAPRVRGFTVHAVLVGAG